MRELADSRSDVWPHDQTPCVHRRGADRCAESGTAAARSRQGCVAELRSPATRESRDSHHPAHVPHARRHSSLLFPWGFRHRTFGGDQQRRDGCGVLPRLGTLLNTPGTSWIPAQIPARSNDGPGHRPVGDRCSGSMSLRRMCCCAIYDACYSCSIQTWLWPLSAAGEAQLVSVIEHPRFAPGWPLYGPDSHAR